jgi:hypothetical protein
VNLKKISLLPWALALVLTARGLRADYGSRFLVDKEAPVKLSAPSQELSYRFTCLQGGMLSLVSVFCSQGNQPMSVRLALYRDGQGLPSGPVLREADFIPNPGSWVSLDFSGTVLEKSLVYHLVLKEELPTDGAESQSDPGNPGSLAGRWSSFAATSPLNRTVPFGDQDMSSQTLFFDGHAWHALDLQPVYLLRIGSGLEEGNPCAQALALPFWGNGPQQAQVLHFTCEFIPRFLEARLRTRGRPDQPVLYRLLEPQEPAGIYQESARGEIPASQIPSEWAWVKVPVKMETGDQKVYVEPFGLAFSTKSGEPDGRGSCRDCYELEGMQVPPGIQDAAEATFDGGAGRSHASTSPDGRVWHDFFETDANVVLGGVGCQRRLPAPPPQPAVPLPPSFSDLQGQDEP